MKKVFISHPYADNPEKNKNRVDKICKEVLGKGYLPISPLHLFSYMENDNFRKEVLQACFNLIDLSDEVWIYGMSEGCSLELEYALKAGKIVKRMFGG